MKKKSKLLGILFLFFFIFSATGCQTNFCTQEDYDNIINGLVLKMTDGTGEGVYAKPDQSTLESKNYTIEGGGELVWENLTPEQQKDYAISVYEANHPKACLTIEERQDKISGGTISAKTFEFSAGRGLLELLAYPLSWLIVTFANLMSGNQLSGITICVSIVIVTFMVRALVMLLTFKQTKQTQAMQALQPELDRINNKYLGRDDLESKNAKSMEMMNLYKKHNINPMSSLLAPFITLPIFIAVYSAVQHTTVIFEGSIFGIELGTKISDAITKQGNWFAILIFVLMSITQFLTMKLPQWLNKKKVPTYKKKNEGNQMMGQGQMMTYFMLIMVVFIGWMLPCAMSVYWLASSLFSIVQTFLLDYLKKKEKPTTPEYGTGVFRK